MGNRVGSPPADSDEDEEEQRENETEDDGTVQTGLGSGGSGAGAAPGVPPDGEVVPDDGEEDEADAEPGEDEAEPPAEPDTPAGSDGSEPGDHGQENPGDGGDHEPDRDSESEDDQDDEDEDPRFVYGDIVFDRDRVEEDEVGKDDLFVVVTLPEKTIDEWECGDGETVADRDPHYPPRDDVVVVVEKEVLDEAVPSWDEREEEIPVSALAKDGVPYEVFPSLRLELFEESHLRDSEFL